VGVTPVGYSYMTHFLRTLCNKVVVVLEGGYDLNALAISAQGVIETLQIASDEVSKVNELLEK
jgi:acetoin utilization deacetylase AcuC-like enzyme